MVSFNSHNYESLKNLAAQCELPAMFVDMEALDHNIACFKQLAMQSGKKIRIATKSIRVPFLIQYIFKELGETASGLMTYCAREAAFLAELGCDHFLIAYPNVTHEQVNAIKQIQQLNKSLLVMVDSKEQIDLLDAQCGTEQPLSLCVDVDMSLRLGPFHFGVQRSPLRTLDDVKRLLSYQKSHLPVVGIMGYEAQIAGVADQSPYRPWLNPAKAFIKMLSRKKVARIRHQIAQQFPSLALFNGGGTGSFHTTAQEPWITEVTVGSGFLQGHLFDYYRAHQQKGALFFALPVCRHPSEHIVTCYAGGYIASGEPGWDKLPRPVIPEGLKTLSFEGFGEVQTPFILPSSVRLKLNDPVFCRPAKSGEIAERFNHYYLVRDQKIIDAVPTYRGLQKFFG